MVLPSNLPLRLQYSARKCTELWHKTNYYALCTTRTLSFWLGLVLQVCQVAEQSPFHMGQAKVPDIPEYLPITINDVVHKVCSHIYPPHVPPPDARLVGLRSVVCRLTFNRFPTCAVDVDDGIAVSMHCSLIGCVCRLATSWYCRLCLFMLCSRSMWSLCLLGQTVQYHQVACYV